ncbi:casein kinase I [Drosophila yakuba]|uniref:non-specific serine/threonine protein kinase n=1 Tax=Drosophila yakuba TaxID=7245 RepID=B4NWS2_DROYA|nr:casein kinase I [Drosophila yakuba]EDW87414.1 uncharacterized protein Dyak_GE15064 [Drosophila yakuba]
MEDYELETMLRINSIVVTRRLGSGSFGDIYEGKHLGSGLHVALKVERKDVGGSHLPTEYTVYNLLRHGMGFPSTYQFLSNKRHNVMVMELLGQSLENLFVLCHRRFSTKTVLMLGEQMVERLEYLHSYRYLHRDIKPDNFLMGCGDTSHRLHLIDFGLAKRYWDMTENKHVRQRRGTRLTGTARYASINALCGGEQSRRDDMESVGYVLMYLLRGRLPWQGLVANSREQKHEMITEMKLSTSPKSLCAGYPTEFYTYIDYTRRLGFEEEPDYRMIRCSFLALMYSMKYINDHIYDWDLVESNAEKGGDGVGNEVELGVV